MEFGGGKSADGSLEEPKDAGPGEAGEVKRWMLELDLAAKTERNWHRNARKAVERYRNEYKTEDGRENPQDRQFNIFWSNVEVLRPHLYASTPKADVRRRFRDADPVGKIAAEVMERALDFSIDSSDFDAEMGYVTLDYLIPSRGIARVRFDPVIGEQRDGHGNAVLDEDGNPAEELSFARTYIERWPWDRFRRGPGEVWGDVTWIAYDHQLTKEEIRAKFPGMSPNVDYDVTMDGVSDEMAATEPSVFKRVRVWEIWDKQGREVLWLAPSYKGEFLKREEDKLALEGFFDCERPLYAVETGTTLVPIVEYDMYRAQAKELDEVTNRISKLIRTLKQRGIYDSTITEFRDLFKAGDNEMIPTDTANLAMQAGGIDKAVWLMPIETAAAVLKQLYDQREQVKQTIYELTGISDILRGSSDPDETLGAQQLKAQTGGKRLERRQRDVQRFVRGMIRKMAEIIAQNYTPEILQMMTGIQLPTAEQKAQAQMQLQTMQQPPAPPQPGQPPAPPVQPPPKELIAAANSPSWDEVMQILRSDLMRTFRIDIETDSTIAPDQAAERQQVTELISGIGSFVNDIGPAVEQGAISMDAAKQILASCLRRFKLGREVEDAIEQDSGTPAPPKPDPEAQKAQAQMQIEQAKMKMQMELEQFKAQNDAKVALAQQQAQAQQDTQSQQVESQREKEKLVLEHESETKKLVLQHQLDLQRIQAENDAKLQQIQADKAADMEIKRQEIGARMQAENDGRKHEYQIKGLKTPEEQEEEMKQVADAVQALAGNMAESTRAHMESSHAHMQIMQQHVEHTKNLGDKLEQHAGALSQLAATLAAPRVAVRDKDGRIIGSKTQG